MNRIRGISLRLLLALFIIALVQNSRAQEGIGSISDYQMPINQVSTSPALIVDQKPWISINVLGMNAYGRTNFLYLPNQTLTGLNGESQFSFDAPSKNGKANVNAEVLGPSLSLAYHEHAIAFRTAVRAYANLNKVPAVLGEIIADGGPDQIDDGVYQTKNARLKSMAWSEIGLTYGRMLYKRNRELLSGAVSVNRLLGIQQANLFIKDAQLDVIQGKGTFRNLDGEYAYAEPDWGNGKGWSLGLGVNYKMATPKYNLDDHFSHTRKGGCKKPDYKYQIAASLIDVGYLNFRQESRSAKLSDTLTVSDLEEAVEEALGVEKRRYTAILPSALSIQADYWWKDQFYLNAVLIQKLSFAGTFGAERANLIAISPRYETTWFSASLPLSLVNYETPQIGLYLRLGPLAIGTDHLSPFFIKQDIRAASLSVDLNIPIQRSPECRDQSAKDNGKWFCPVW